MKKRKADDTAFEDLTKIKKEVQSLGNAIKKQGTEANDEKRRIEEMFSSLSDISFKIEQATNLSQLGNDQPFDIQQVTESVRKALENNREFREALNVSD